jgi:hypothetical protein
VQLVKPQAEENVAISRYYDTAADVAPVGAAGRLDDTLDLVKSYGPQSGLAVLALVSLAMMLRLAKKSDAGESFGLELGLPKEAIEAAKVAASDVSAVASRPGYAAAARRAAAAGGAARGRETGVAEAEMAATIEHAPVTEGVLVAQEVDAGTIQTRKMLEQVSQMAESDPDAVSALVEQWVIRNEQYHDENS